MAEILGVLGTIATISSLASEGTTLVKNIRAFLKHAEEAEEEGNSIVRHIVSVSTALEQLSTNLEKEKERRICSDRFYEELSSTLHQCQLVFKDVQKFLDAALPGILEANEEPSSSTGKRKDHLKWPLRRSKIIQAQDELRKIRAELQFSVTVMIHAYQLTADRELHHRRASKKDRSKKQRALQRKLFGLRIQAIRLEAMQAELTLENASVGGVHEEMSAFSDGNDGSSGDAILPTEDPKSKPQNSTPNEAPLSVTPPSPESNTPKTSLEETRSGPDTAGTAPSAKSRTAGESNPATSTTTTEHPMEPAKVQTKENPIHVPNDQGPDVQPPEVGKAFKEEDKADVQPRSIMRRRSIFWRTKRPSDAETLSRSENASVHTESYKSSTPASATVLGSESWIFYRDQDESLIMCLLPMNAADTAKVVLEFRRKSKSVWEYYWRLPLDFHQAISDKLTYNVEQGNQIPYDPKPKTTWVIAALKIRPKRARSNDVQSVQVVLEQRLSDDTPSVQELAQLTPKGPFLARTGLRRRHDQPAPKKASDSRIYAGPNVNPNDLQRQGQHHQTSFAQSRPFPLQAGVAMNQNFPPPPPRNFASRPTTSFHPAGAFPNAPGTTFPPPGAFPRPNGALFFDRPPPPPPIDIHGPMPRPTQNRQFHGRDSTSDDIIDVIDLGSPPKQHSNEHRKSKLDEGSDSMSRSKPIKGKKPAREPHSMSTEDSRYSGATRRSGVRFSESDSGYSDQGTPYSFDKPLIARRHQSRTDRSKDDSHSLSNDPSYAASEVLSRYTNIDVSSADESES